MSWYAPAAGSVAPRTDHPTYGGPIAVLASSATGSAAEDFLAAFHAARRGVIIGEPSAGSAGDVATFALPKGWGVQFCVTRHTFPDGTEFAGLGVPPDVLVVPTVDAMLARSEPALARARAYFEGGGARP
jgi:carboxyl-terminal processing protease